eukprot:scaffold683_cov423-Prasinococcus_capsulatus_cf.AAC.11
MAAPRAGGAMQHCGARRPCLARARRDASSGKTQRRGVIPSYRRVVECTSGATTRVTTQHVACERRRLFQAVAGLATLICGEGASCSPASASDWTAAVVDVQQTPTISADGDEDLLETLQEASGLFRQALEAATVEEEERVWSTIISEYGGIEQPWAIDAVSRAYGMQHGGRCSEVVAANVLGRC